MEQFLERYAKIPASQRYAGVALLVGALVAGFYYLIYQPQRDSLQHREHELRTALAQAADKENVAQNLKTYEERLANLQRDLDRAKALLPDSDNVPELLAQLGNAAHETGLEIVKFQPQGETIKDFYAVINFSIQVRGSYNEIAMFIDRIGKLDRIVNVTDLTMKNPKTQQEKVVVDGSFQVKTYRFVSAAERKANAKKKKKRRR